MNYFAEIPGNDLVKKYLCRIVEKGTVPQSLLFAGPEGAGKALFALAFAKMVVGTESDLHPDIRVYKPEGKIGQHSIQTMREFCNEVYLAPFQSKRKVFIIHDAHRMLTYSANALLKTFEEPSLDSVIILISSAPGQLLPTVLSRCQMVRFHAASQKQQEHDPLRALMLGALAQGVGADYISMLQVVKEVGSQMEAALKEEEKKLRSEIMSGFNEKMTAAQTQAIEKEVEGALCLQRMNGMQQVFYAVLSWHRDLELLHLKGDPSMLINADYANELAKALKNKQNLPLEKVQAAVKKAHFMLERSAPVAYCLEHLFLAL